ncbi:MAG TPA: HAD-IB family phosphatase [Candidatus Limnocylindrales bacterium]|nr:HAD-IB family phosphatase [Candidatus Limnocylindrales bacterium]
MAAVEKRRLVVFDAEGVLIPKNLFFFDVEKSLGFVRLIRVLFYGFLYETGILKLDSVLKNLFNELKGVKLDALTAIFEKIPSTNMQSIFSQIKARNCKIALISSGLPTVIVKKLADSLGADYAYGVEVETKDGELTGKISGDAIEPNGKLKILNQILTAENLSLSDSIIVADDRNNRSMFQPGTLKIGFNPDFIIRIKADRVVNGKLSGIIPIIDGKPNRRSFPSANDLTREGIHSCGIFMPIIAGLIGIPVVGALIFIIVLTYTVSELLRLEGKSLTLISSITRHAASQSELHGFAAAPLYFAGGILFTLLVFPHPASYAAIAMFCLGDSAASLFGGRISTSLPFNKAKTWEGSLAGLLFAFLGGLLFLPSKPLLAFAGAAIAMTVEVLPLPVNDNVLVPIITGAALTLLI